MGIIAYIRSGRRGSDRLLIDRTFGAVRSSYSPLEYTDREYNLGGHYAFSTAALIPASFGTGGVVLACRWPGPGYFMLGRIRVGAVIQTALTAVQVIGLNAASVRRLASRYTGGTALDANLAGDFGKTRQSMSTSRAQFDVMNATALAAPGGAGQDGLAFAQEPMPISANTAGAGYAMNPIYDAAGNHQHPQIYQQNEGFVLSNFLALPIAGAIQVFIQVEWAEVASF